MVWRGVALGRVTGKAIMESSGTSGTLLQCLRDMVNQTVAAVGRRDESRGDEGQPRAKARRLNVQQLLAQHGGELAVCVEPRGPVGCAEVGRKKLGRARRRESLLGCREKLGR